MNLQEMANQHLKNFNAATDNPNQMDDGLPAGSYDVVVDQAGHRVYKSGYDAVAFNLEVVQGDHVGRKELINIDLDGEATQKYEFLMKKNIQMISQMAYVCGIELTEADWESEDTVGNAFREAVGKQLILHVEKGQTKKGKDFTNYSFEAYADDIIDVDDSNIPF